MGFMQQDIQYGDWATLDDRYGSTVVVPADYATDIIRDEHPDDWDDYVNERITLGELRDRVNYDERTAYGARLSAPGYMDSTDWSLFDTLQEAKDCLRDVYDLDDDDDEPCLDCLD